MNTNIAGFLKSHRFTGQVFPINKNDEQEPVIALLVPVGIAMDEYQGWSGQDITRHDFIKNLRDNGVHVFNNIDEFIKLRDSKKKLEKIVKSKKVKHKRALSDERKLQLKEHASLMRAKIRPTISSKS